MIKYLLILLPFFLSAIDLKELLIKIKSNELIKSYDYQTKSYDAQINSIDKSYLPSIDASLSASSSKVLSPDNAFSMESESFVPTAGLKLSVTLFDGFYKSNKKDDLKAQKQSTIHTKDATLKSLQLTLSELYFGSLNISEDIKALNTKHDMLVAQRFRLEQFYNNGIVTIDEVEKIKSAILANQIQLDELNYNLDRLKLNIEIISGISVKKLSYSTLLSPNNQKYSDSSEVLAMIKKVDSLNAQIKMNSASNYPLLNVSNTFSYSYYGDNYETPALLSTINLDMPKTQQKIALSLSMNITDFGASSLIGESLKLQKLSLLEQINYKKREKKSKFNLAIKYIKIAKSTIDTTKQNLIANQKTFDAIEKKYKARVVDNIAYLDALSSLSNAQATYAKSKNNYNKEIARYYYAQGKNLIQYIKVEK